MKRVLLFVIFFAFAANVSAQLQVDEAGDTHVSGNIYLGGTSNFLGTSSTVPITLKVNGVLAGSTGASGKFNVSFGYAALTSNTTGTYNTAIGYGSLTSNTMGVYNTAIGYAALISNTNGYSNTAIGYRTLSSNTNGDYNIATGYQALYSNTTGSYNIADGWRALYSNTTGSYNICIGYDADVYTNNLSNATAIGYNALANSSNQVRIGNSSVTSIGGFAGWTNFSDGRTKKNIRTDVPGLAFINRLQPVTFNLDLDAVDALLKIDKTKMPDGEELSPELIEIEKKAREAKEKVVQTGFIAQDVEEAAKSANYNFSGVDVDETGIYGLRYAEFVVPLVKAVQELSEQNDRLQTQNERLQTKVNEFERLQAQVNELTELVRNLQEKK